MYAVNSACRRTDASRSHARVTFFPRKEFARWSITYAPLHLPCPRLPGFSLDEVASSVRRSMYIRKLPIGADASTRISTARWQRGWVGGGRRWAVDPGCAVGVR